jgi:dihydrofolate synthase/folylpolyglutamate synthase
MTEQAAHHWIYSPDSAVEAAVAGILHKYPHRYTGGVARTLELLQRLDNPHLRLPPVFHVAGTNGKGSTLAFLQAAFQAGGLSVHKFTSPHLIRFEERFVLNGQMISGPLLLALIAECDAAAGGMPISFFEFFTVLMFLAAARYRADALLLETGLGGTLDATNVVERSVAILTRISFDHMHILGETLEKIADNKAGIMRSGCPVIVAPQPDASVMCVFEDKAVLLSAPLFRCGQEWQVLQMEGGFHYEGGTFNGTLPSPALQGAHQILNAGAAIAALEQGGFDSLLKPDILALAMQNVSWPGRMQRLTAGPMIPLLPAGWEVWLDGAHNDSGAEVVAAQARAWGHDKPLHLITMMKGNKETDRFYEVLAPCVRTVLVLDCDIGAPMMVTDMLCEELRRSGISEPVVAKDLESAIAALASQYASPQRILIAGSLYLAGYVLRSHQ